MRSTYGKITYLQWNNGSADEVPAEINARVVHLLDYKSYSMCKNLVLTQRRGHSILFNGLPKYATPLFNGLPKYATPLFNGLPKYATPLFNFRGWVSVCNDVKIHCFDEVYFLVRSPNCLVHMQACWCGQYYFFARLPVKSGRNLLAICKDFS